MANQGLDFSIETLKLLLLALQNSGYQILRFEEFWEISPTDRLASRRVLLRHDVDRFPETAVATARLEAELGIRGTYFFRTRSSVLRAKCVETIAKLGHEIGYHYECLADAKGDYDRAFELVDSDLKRLRSLAPIVSASMHSRPFSPIDGRTLWDVRGLAEFGLKGEAYRSIDHNQFLYLADSGRNWGGNRNVVWDHVAGLQAPTIRSTFDLITKIKASEFESLQLLIHPNRWPSSSLGWAAQWSMDLAINSIKTGIKIARNGRSQW